MRPGRELLLPPALLALALVPLGSTGELAFPVLATVASATYLFLTLVGFRKYGLQAPVRIFAGIDVPTLALFPALAALQFLFQSSGAATVDRVDSFTLLVLASGFFVLTYRAAHSRGHVTFLATVFVALGSLEALYGLLNLLAGNERVLFYSRQAYVESATGTLVSRNHFAYLIELTLPLAVALAMLPGPTGRPAVRAKHSETEARARRFVLAVATTVCALALLFSRSRMGIAGFIAAVTVVLAARLVLVGRSGDPTASGRRWLTPAAIALATLATALALGIDPILERFVTTPHDLEAGRGQIWASAGQMFRDRPLLGHGWGSFEGLLPGFRERPTGMFFRHAHNEYLQVAAETGVVGLTALAYLLGRLAGRLRRVLATPTASPLALGAAVAVISVLFHSVADFGLRVPGVAFAFAYCLALFVRMTDHGSSSEPT